MRIPLIAHLLAVCCQGRRSPFGRGEAASVSLNLV
jgi:hypothetical protein